MSKPYWSGSSTLSGAPGGPDKRSGNSGPVDDTDQDGYDTGATASAGYDAADYDAEDYDAYEYYGHRDNRWRWVAGLAGVVLLVAVVATVAIVRDGNTATTSSTPTSRELSAQDEAPSTTPRTVIATVPPSASATPTPLPPETVVTVTTTPSAVAAAPTPPAEAVPDTRTVTYTVTGSRQLFDLISIIYTDEQGFPHPELNVALPWTKTVVLNPGVTVESVTATSVGGQLNCAITDAAGATVVAQNNNTIITTCTS